MSEQTEHDPAEEPAKTRQELVERLRRWREFGDQPLVRDPKLLRPGDLLDLMHGNFDAPHIDQFLVTEINKRAGKDGIERTFISGFTSATRDFSQYTNNPDKMREYAEMTASNPQGVGEIAELAGAMATRPAVVPGSQSPVEYDAYDIGVASDAEGEFKVGRIAILMQAASQPTSATT